MLMRRLIFRVPKRDHNFDNHPHAWTTEALLSELEYKLSTERGFHSIRLPCQDRGVYKRTSRVRGFLILFRV